MKKIIALLFISTLVWANPLSIHFSALGKYLVDQNGNKTKIQGHPLMECHEGSRIIKGKFVKEIEGKVYLLVTPKTFVCIEKPVCDLK